MNRGLFAAVALLTALQGVLPAATVAVLGLAIDRLTQGAEMGAVPLLWVGLGLCTAALSYSRIRLTRRLVLARIRADRERVVAVALRQPGRDPGQVLQAVHHDVEELSQALGARLGLVREGLSALGLGISALTAAPLLAAVLAPFAAMALGAVWFGGRQVKALSGPWTESRTALWAMATSLSRSAPTLRAFGAVPEGERRWDLALGREERARHALEGSRHASTALIPLFLGIGGGVIWVALGQGWAPAEPERAVAFVVALGWLPRPISALSESWSALRRAQAAGERLAAWGPVPGPVGGGLAAGRPAPAIAARDLRVELGGGPILRGASFGIPAGKVTALVGPSGAGKSTVIAALLGEHPGATGTLVVGDEPRDVRAGVGPCAVVHQDEVLTLGTLREDLQLGSPGATDPVLLEALSRVGLAERFGSELDVAVGPGTAGPSGGERQRLLLARALLSPHPILILDEPLNHLDAVSEGLVVEALLGERGRRTCLVVLHDLAVARRVDHLVLLRDGVVVAEGGAAGVLGQGEAP
jgi:ABC-type multidrug transport system fused ATPase/permease subunit